MSSQILYKSLPAQPSALVSRAKLSVCLPTTSRRRLTFISLSVVATEAEIMKGLHGYVIGYWKKVFAT